MPPSRLERRFYFEEKWLAVAVGRSEASVVKCPICLSEFGWQDVLAGRLRDEHAISRKLGGRIVTLICKVCNNAQGSGLDKHVVEAARIRDAFA